MKKFRILDHYPSDVLSGATLGGRHLEYLLEYLKPNAASSGVIIDFDQVVGATGSYLKEFLLRFLVTHQAAAEIGESGGDVFLANLHEDVAFDLRGVLVDAGLACLEVIEHDDVRVRKARCHGDLEPVVRDALNTLIALRSATAADLGRRDKKVGVTAWHYRLGVLLKLGLARRSKFDRSWLYEPTAMEVITNG